MEGTHLRETISMSWFVPTKPQVAKNSYKTEISNEVKACLMHAYT